MAAMTRNVEAEIRQIVAEQLDLDRDEVTPEKTFVDDLGADSRTIFELALAFEEAFDIDIADTEIEAIRTVSDAIARVEAKLVRS